MTPDELARLAVAETEIKNLKDTLEEVRDDVKALRTLAENARGGWRTLMAVGGIGTAVGAMIVKVAPLLGKG